MWYRLELNKDGSAASCTEAEGSKRDGKTVLYVEASSKSEAIKLGRAKFFDRLAAQRDAALAAGFCGECCVEKAMKGRTMCARCAEKKLARRQERESRGRPLTQAETTERRREAFRSSRPGWVPVLRATLKMFDSLPPAKFRSWLVQQLKFREDVAAAGQQTG